MDYEKIILVTRKTRLEGLVERFNTKAQARFYLEHSAAHQGQSGAEAFTRYEVEHETYYAAVKRLEAGLQALAKMQEIERGFLPTFLFAQTDLVVTVGIDGLVVNTAKYLSGQPLVAVNPDPARVDGVLLPYTVDSGLAAVRQALRGELHTRPVSMAQATLNDGQSLLAFNDLFIGARSHVSARYRIRWQGQAEHHSSSGVIVSTGAGATGWLSSLFNMAEGLWAGFGAGQEATQPARLARPALTWESERLVYVVREPFTSKTSGAGLVCGAITPGSELVIESEMPEGGVIFSDGVETDRLDFNAGAVAAIGLAPQKTNLVWP